MNLEVNGILQLIAQSWIRRGNRISINGNRISEGIGGNRREKYIELFSRKLANPLLVNLQFWTGPFSTSG